MVRRQGVLEPPQRLHDPHRRSSGPIQLAGSGLPELDGEVVETDRATASVGMNDHVRRNRSRETEIVRGSEAVDEHANLVASGEGINDLAIVRNHWSFGQVVDPGHVVQASVDASQLASLDQTLKRLINGVSTAKIEEVHRCPHVSRWSARDSICEGTFKVGHRPIFVYKFRTRETTSRASDLWSS